MIAASAIGRFEAGRIVAALRAEPLTLSGSPWSLRCSFGGTRIAAPIALLLTNLIASKAIQNAASSIQPSDNTVPYTNGVDGNILHQRRNAPCRHSWAQAQAVLHSMPHAL